MLYFASLYLMLKCSTPTGKNVHLLQKRIAEAFQLYFTQHRIKPSGLARCCALLKPLFTVLLFYTLKRGWNKNRLGIPNYISVYYNTGFIRLKHLPESFCRSNQIKHYLKRYLVSFTSFWRRVSSHKGNKEIASAKIQ